MIASEVVSASTALPAELLSIWIKRFKRGPMDAVQSVELIAGKGVAGSADQGGRRQVTIIDEAVWLRLMRELGGTIDPSARRANLMVRGLELNESRQKLLAISDVRIRIFNETRPCERMDEALPGLRQAMKRDWGGGAFGEVVTGGTIRVGDSACWVASE